MLNFSSLADCIVVIWKSVVFPERHSKLFEVKCHDACKWFSKKLYREGRGMEKRKGRVLRAETISAYIVAGTLNN